MSELKYQMMTPVAHANVGVRILEKDKDDNLIGEYTGYYRAREDTFVLYPAYNCFARGNGTLKKKKIWASDVRYYGKEK